MTRFSRPAAAGLLAALCALPLPARALPTLAQVDARARAFGNRRPEAMRLGRALFTTVWPVQIKKVRVDGYGPHLVAGLVLSGKDFHGAVTPASLEDEVRELVSRSFAASAVEEIDVWAIVPLPTYAHEIVSGDRAQPTSRTVFAVTVRRDEAPGFADRLRRGDGVFWERAWRDGLAAR